MNTNDSKAAVFVKYTGVLENDKEFEVAVVYRDDESEDMRRRKILSSSIGGARVVSITN